MKTLCAGEALWDWIGTRAFWGGATLNAAAHLAHLGVESYLLSTVGDNTRGRLAIERFHRLPTLGSCRSIPRGKGIENDQRANAGHGSRKLHHIVFAILDHVYAASAKKLGAAV